MLSRIKCNGMVTKEEVRQNIKPEIQLLSERLSVLQQRLKEAKIPMIVVFEGDKYGFVDSLFPFVIFDQHLILAFLKA